MTEEEKVLMACQADDRPHKEPPRTRLLRCWVLPLLVFAGIAFAGYQARGDSQTGGCLAVEVGMSSGAYCPDEATP